MIYSITLHMNYLFKANTSAVLVLVIMHFGLLQNLLVVKCQCTSVAHSFKQSTMVRSASQVPGWCTVKQLSKTLALLARRKERDLRNFQPSYKS